MADPSESYPESATLGGDAKRTNGETPESLRVALAEHGEELAAAIETTDELSDILTTAIIVAASADEAELDHVTNSTANLVEAADGLTTDQAAQLASELGENADDLSDALETVLELQRTGNLDDLVSIASAFSESLSADEVEELGTMLEQNGSDLVDALDVVLELHREDQLEDLVALAETLSTLEIDQDTADGLNTVLGAVGEAQRTSEPVSLLGLLRGFGSKDARAGLGYLLSLLKAQGRRVRRK